MVFRTKNSQWVYEKVVNGIDEEIMLISKDYKILWANRIAIDTYGHDVINKHCYFVTHGFDFPCQGPFDLCPINDVLATGRSCSTTHIHTTSHDNGDEHHVLINIYPIKDGSGEINRFVHVARDITESVVHRQMEEKMWLEIIKVIDRIYEELIDNQLKLEERTSELEKSSIELRETQERLIRSEKLAAIGQLAASVAHELRNPLGVIKNSAYYLRERIDKSGLTSEDQSIFEFLNIIENEIGMSDKIIKDLLNFSKISSPLVKPTDINDIILDILFITKKPENIIVETVLYPDIKKVMVDPYQIRQAFNNLILNAFQAMEDGGVLKIITREKDGFVDAEFTDTGWGIREEDQERIFDALYTTKARGFGLGLAVTRGIIERHEGQIKVKSRIGEGTTFIIRLPIK
ncbi:MAG: ATP-binding protein [Nitrospirota bacterium]